MTNYDINTLNIQRDSEGKVISFDIDRRWWSRGIPMDTPSALLLPSGKMCCLGFYARACGLPKNTILKMGFFKEIESIIPQETKWLLDAPFREPLAASRMEHTIGSINDKEHTPEEVREQFIKEKFLAQGITVNFIN